MAFHPFAHFFTVRHPLFFVRALEAVVEADVYDIAPVREAHVTEHEIQKMRWHELRDGRHRGRCSYIDCASVVDNVSFNVRN